MAAGTKGYREVCPKCHQKYKSDGLKYICPHCGKIGWGQIITFFVIGLICLFLYFYITPSIPTTSLRVAARVLTVLVGVLSPFAGLIAVTRAVFTKKPSLNAEHTHSDEMSQIPRQKSGMYVANPEHVAKWKEGIEAWTRWRDLNPEIRPNLKGAELSESIMEGANLMNADLSGAILKQSNLYLARLENAELTNANLYQVNLSCCVTDQMTKLQNANLHLANLSNAKLVMVDLNGANLKVANLSGSNLNRAILQYVNLSFANLNGADLSQADCRNALFSDVDLSHTNLRMAFYNQGTIWPSGFNPIAAGAILEL